MFNSRQIGETERTPHPALRATFPRKGGRASGTGLGLLPAVLYRRMFSQTSQGAFVKADQLPPEDQDRIGRDLSRFIDDLRSLRDDVQAAAIALDAGHGRPLDIEAIIARARAKHADAVS